MFVTANRTLPYPVIEISCAEPSLLVGSIDKGGTIIGSHLPQSSKRGILTTAFVPPLPRGFATGKPIKLKLNLKFSVI